MALKGMIKAIEQNAVHDGPGTRLLVFLKGCNMRCKWCQNPETWTIKPEVWFNKNLCKDLGECVKVCPTDAVTMDKDNKLIAEKCNQCFDCVEVCKPGALAVVGMEMTAEELAKKIASYKFFITRNRGGGVTISGGEPTFQADFTAEVLRLTRKEGIHTMVETNLFTRYDDIWKVASNCDMIICDIKHMDSDKHKESTGVSNKSILENLTRLNKEYEGEIAVHIPLIPGFNDDEENIVKTLEFLKPLEKVVRIDLLPFNTLAEAKFMSLGKDWPYKGVEKQSKEYLENLKKTVKSFDKFDVTIGGLW